MKLSTGYVKTAFRVREKRTGKEYDCFIQDYEYTNGHRQGRFNIGINGYHEWNFLFYLEADDFNEEFEVA